MTNNYSERQLKHIIEQNEYKLQYYSKYPIYKDKEKHEFHLQLFRSRIEVAKEDLQELTKKKKTELSIN
jgi:hypothetical protein